MQDMESAGWWAGASGDCSLSRIRPPELKPTRCRVQVPAADPLSNMRFERAVVRVHQLGPRAVGELLREISHTHGLAGDIEERLARYARLDPEIVRAMGWDHFPPLPVHLVAARP